MYVISWKDVFTYQDRTVVVFFFQAEDGIRDVAVTGVQTCALPICLPGRARLLHAAPPPEGHRGSACSGHSAPPGREDRRALRRCLQEAGLPWRRHLRVPL